MNSPPDNTRNVQEHTIQKDPICILMGHLYVSSESFQTVVEHIFTIAFHI